MYYVLCLLDLMLFHYGFFSNLTPHNYATWKENIKEPLVEKGLLCYVIGATNKSPIDVDKA